MATITKVKAKDGKWRYRVRVVTGHRPDGSAIQQMRTYATRREADVEGAKWEAEIARGMAVDGSKTKLRDFLKEWLTRAAKRVRPSTFSDYQYTTEHYLLPRVGGLTLRTATPKAMQAVIDQAPSAYLATKWRRLLHIAFEEAANLNLLALNPMERIKTPARPKSAATAWTQDQAKRFLALAAGKAYRPYFHLAVYTGMRPSELLALKWASLDVAAGTLAITEAYPNVMGRRFEGPPKSDAGHRVIRLDSALLAVLRAHHSSQLEQRLLLGERWKEHNLVCASAVGTPIELTNIRRRFVKLCQEANVPRIRLYDLRHTTTSIMLEQGADLKAVSEVLGHADPGITQRVYQHVRAEQREKALSLLAGALSEVGSHR